MGWKEGGVEKKRAEKGQAAPVAGARDRERASELFFRDISPLSPPIASSFDRMSKRRPGALVPAGWRGRRKSTSKRGKGSGARHRTAQAPRGGGSGGGKEERGCRSSQTQRIPPRLPPMPPFATTQRCTAATSFPSAGGEALPARGKGPLSTSQLQSFSPRENCGRETAERRRRLLRHRAPRGGPASWAIKLPRTPVDASDQRG